MRDAIVIEKAANNYSAFVPDLPGCIATGPGAGNPRGDPLSSRRPARRRPRDAAADQPRRVRGNLIRARPRGNGMTKVVEAVV